MKRKHFKEKMRGWKEKILLKEFLQGMWQKRKRMKNKEKFQRKIY